jgi:hypothetical protein
VVDPAAVPKAVHEVAGVLVAGRPAERAGTVEVVVLEVALCFFPIFSIIFDYFCSFSIFFGIFLFFLIFQFTYFYFLILVDKLIITSGFSKISLSYLYEFIILYL